MSQADKQTESQAHRNTDSYTQISDISVLKFLLFFKSLKCVNASKTKISKFLRIQYCFLLKKVNIENIEVEDRKFFKREKKNS